MHLRKAKSAIIYNLAQWEFGTIFKICVENLVLANERSNGIWDHNFIVHKFIIHVKHIIVKYLITS